MNSPLRILHLEDDPADLRLVRDALRDDGLEADITVAADRPKFLAALERDGFDLLLADFRLPGFDGLQALALWRARWPDKPFIFVTGSMGEELAVESLKSGATDYVLKQSLPRLIPAIRRAVAESEDYARWQAAEQALRASEEEFRAFFHTTAVGAAEMGLDGRFLRVNDCLCQITGYSREELLRMAPTDLTAPEDRAKDDQRLSDYLRGPNATYDAEKRYVRKDGQIIWVQVTAAMVRDAAGQPLRWAGIIKDITARKQAEKELRATNAELVRFNRVMVNRELRMVELKQEVNELCAAAGQPPRYPLAGTAPSPASAARAVLSSEN